MDIERHLMQGIQAAKSGEREQARGYFYAVIDQEPGNEAAWVWLSYVVDTVEDRRVCLENVLTVNPQNQYAQKGLAKINQGQLTSKKTTSPAKNGKSLADSVRQWAWVSVVAFWVGAGVLFFSVGVLELLTQFWEMVKSRTFPYYITPSQLWNLVIATLFLITGIVLCNIAWAVFAKHKIGYFVSILFSMAFIFIGPTILVISGNKNFLLPIFAAAMPTVILFLTLISQAGFTNEQELAFNARPN